MSKITISKEEFEELYFNQELSTRDIAKKLGVGQTTVRRFMTKHDINHLMILLKQINLIT